MAARLPKGWKRIELGELVEIGSGGTPSRANADYWGGNMPWITAKDMKSFDLRDSIDRLTDSGAAHASVVPQDTILVLVRGMGLFKDVPIGVTARPMAFNQDIKALRQKGDVSARFLGHALRNQRHYLMGIVDQAGHGTGRLQTSFLEELPLVVPPQEEQHRIVAALDAWDRGVLILRQAAEAKKLVARTTFFRAAARLPGASVRLADIAAINSQSLPEGTDPKMLIEYFDVGSVGDVDESGLIRFRDAPSRARRLANAGDVVYATVRPLLRRIFKAVASPNTVYSTGYAVIAADDSASSNFLFHAMTSDAVERQIYAASTGSGYPAISTSDLGEVRLTLPAKSDQLKVAELVDAMLDEATTLEKQCAAFDQQKRGLMQKLLTGQWRLPRDLPAAAEAAHV